MRGSILVGVILFCLCFSAQAQKTFYVNYDAYRFTDPLNMALQDAEVQKQILDFFEKNITFLSEPYDVTPIILEKPKEWNVDHVFSKLEHIKKGILKVEFHSIPGKTYILRMDNLPLKTLQSQLANHIKMIEAEEKIKNTPILRKFYALMKTKILIPTLWIKSSSLMLEEFIPGDAFLYSSEPTNKLSMKNDLFFDFWAHIFFGGFADGDRNTGNYIVLKDNPTHVYMIDFEYASEIKLQNPIAQIITTLEEMNRLGYGDNKYNLIIASAINQMLAPRASKVESYVMELLLQPRKSVYYNLSILLDKYASITQLNQNYNAVAFYNQTIFSPKISSYSEYEANKEYEKIFFKLQAIQYILEAFPGTMTEADEEKWLEVINQQAELSIKLSDFKEHIKIPSKPFDLLSWIKNCLK